MKIWIILNENDHSDSFEIEAQTFLDAVIEALENLEWRLMASVETSENKIWTIIHNNEPDYFFEVKGETLLDAASMALKSLGWVVISKNDNRT